MTTQQQEQIRINEFNTQMLKERNKEIPTKRRIATKEEILKIQLLQSKLINSLK